MKKTGILLITLVVLLASCHWPGQQSNMKVLNDSIAALEKDIFNPDKDKLDRVKAIELIDLYQKVAQEDPKVRLHLNIYSKLPIYQ